MQGEEDKKKGNFVIKVSPPKILQRKTHNVAMLSRHIDLLQTTTKKRITRPEVMINGKVFDSILFNGSSNSDNFNASSILNSSVNHDIEKHLKVMETRKKSEMMTPKFNTRFRKNKSAQFNEPILTKRLSEYFYQDQSNLECIVEKEDSSASNRTNKKKNALGTSFDNLIVD